MSATTGGLPVIASVIQWSWISQNSGAIWSALGQHAQLTAIAIGVGLGIALPVSLLVWRFSRLRAAVIGFTGLLYTIPSIALFAILQPVTGYFTVTTAEVALVSYTQLVLIRNIVTGLDEVPVDVREAARAMGYSPVAEFFKVDLPLAFPSIIAGLRVATVTVVGLVNVTAFIGLGGLGQFIIQGFQRRFSDADHRGACALDRARWPGGLVLRRGAERGRPLEPSDGRRLRCASLAEVWSFLHLSRTGQVRTALSTGSNCRRSSPSRSLVPRRSSASVSVSCLVSCPGAGCSPSTPPTRRAPYRRSRCSPLLATIPAIGLNDGGFPTAFITLFALAVPPIVTNSYVGIREVDPDIREAARASGMTGWQRFFKVELPLALPLAVAGVRTAAVEVVATATLAAYVTFNDLGEFIFAGLSVNDAVEAFGGAVLGSRCWPPPPTCCSSSPTGSSLRSRYAPRSATRRSEDADFSSPRVVCGVRRRWRGCSAEAARHPIRFSKVAVVEGIVVEGDHSRPRPRLPDGQPRSNGTACLTTASTRDIRRARMGRATSRLSRSGKRTPLLRDDAAVIVEAHLIDFDGDLYGERLQVEIEELIRNQARFECEEGLRAQIAADVDAVRLRHARSIAPLVDPSACDLLLRRRGALAVVVNAERSSCAERRWDGLAGIDTERVNARFDIGRDRDIGRAGHATEIGERGGEDGMRGPHGRPDRFVIPQRRVDLRRQSGRMADWRTPPIGWPVAGRTSSAVAGRTSVAPMVAATRSVSTRWAPLDSTRTGFPSDTKTRLFAIAPTAQPRAAAASFAVRVEAAALERCVCARPAFSSAATRAAFRCTRFYVREATASFKTRRRPPSTAFRSHGTSVNLKKRRTAMIRQPRSQRLLIRAICG